MIRALIAGASLVVLVATSASASEACQRNVSNAATSTILSESRIDKKLLDAAIRAEFNFHRCRAGLDAVAYGGGSLASVANTHSSWMAKTKKLSHVNTIGG